MAKIEKNTINQDAYQEPGLDEKGESSIRYDDVGRALFETALTYDTAQLEQDAKKIKKKLDFVVLPMVGDLPAKHSFRPYNDEL